MLFKKYFRYVWGVLLLVSAVLITLTACEEVIDVDIEDIDQKIVIDGAITDNPGGSRVLLSLTENVFSANSNTKVSGAMVFVEDDAGNSEMLIESVPGKYLFSSMRGEYGRTYTIKVEHNGRGYAGVSTLNLPMVIDSIRFIQTYSYSVWGIPFYFYKIKLYMQNRKGIDEYCIIKINGSNNINYSTIVYQDKYAEDKPIALEGETTSYQFNERVTIELLTIDKAAYRYFFHLNELSEESGLDVPDILNINTYNPKSNLSNGALGCFYAYSYKKYTATVK